MKENDSGSGQHRTVRIAQDGPQNAVQSMPIILECRHRQLHMWASLKETVANRGFIEYTLDLLSVPEYVIKKGRLDGHIHGNSQEAENIIGPIN